MDRILKFSVARLLTSPATANTAPDNDGGSNDDATSNQPVSNNLLIQATNAVEQQQQQQSAAAFTQVLYDSMMLNALLLHLDNNQRHLLQQGATGLDRRNFVEFYQPSQSSHQPASGTSHDRLLLAIADNCPPTSSQSNGISHQQNAPLISALGPSYWQPTVFHPSAFMSIDTPPLRPRKAAPRAVFSMLQRRGLERYFQQHKYISRTERRRISATLGLTDVQVKIWFQNRRMKWRQNSMPPEMEQVAANSQQQAHSAEVEAGVPPIKNGSRMDQVETDGANTKSQYKHPKISLI